MAIQTANRLLASLKFLETRAELKNPKTPFQAVVLNQRNRFDLTGLNQMFSNAKANYPSLVPISNLWEDFYKELIADSFSLTHVKSSVDMFSLELKYIEITDALKVLNIKEFSQEALKRDFIFSTTDLVLVPDHYPKDQMLKNQITQSEFQDLLTLYNQIHQDILSQNGSFRVDLSNQEFLNYVLDSFKLILTRKLGRDFLKTLLEKNFVCEIVQGDENITYFLDNEQIDVRIALNSDIEKSYYGEFYADDFSVAFEKLLPHAGLFHELIHLLHDCENKYMSYILNSIPCPFFDDFEELVSIRGWHKEPFFVRVLNDHFAQKENSEIDFDEILLFLNTNAETLFQFTENLFYKDWGIEGRASHGGISKDKYLSRDKNDDLFYIEILFSIDSIVENLFLEHLKVEDFVKLYEQAQENWDEFKEDDKQKIDLEEITIIYKLLQKSPKLTLDYIVRKVAKLKISIQKKELFVQFIMKRLGIA